MELRHLRYYIAVAEECHFGRAAERLHIAQPPLSQQIKQLEAELGVKLLERSTRKVELTDAGLAYLQRAREVVSAVDAAGDEAVRIADGEVGRLAIGFTGSATYDLLPTMARRLRASMPGIELDLRGEMLTPEQTTALREGVIDLGILRPPVNDPELDLEVLRHEAMTAVVPTDHRLAQQDAVHLSDLADEPFISYPSHLRSVVMQVVVDSCQQAGSPRTSAMRSVRRRPWSPSSRPSSAWPWCPSRSSSSRSPVPSTSRSSTPRRSHWRSPPATATIRLTWRASYRWSEASSPATEPVPTPGEHHSPHLSHSRHQ